MQKGIISVKTRNYCVKALPWRVVGVLPHESDCRVGAKLG